MSDAYHAVVRDFDNVPHGYAAELRAIAEEIDHRVSQCLDDDPAEIATWLRKEADRAEAGD